MESAFLHAINHFLTLQAAQATWGCLVRRHFPDGKHFPESERLFLILTEAKLTLT
jgi:hypothetical protein